MTEEQMQNFLEWKKLRFFEEVVGTMGIYGYGEMSVGSGFLKKYEQGEYHYRTEMYSDLFGAMHPLSGKAIILCAGRATLIERTDKGFKELEDMKEEIFFKEKKILHKENFEELEQAIKNRSLKKQNEGIEY